MKKYGVPLERALEVMDELKDESDALKERIQALEDQVKRAEMALHKLPLEYFNKDESQIDAADFVDCSAEFVDAMNAARAYFAEQKEKGK
jgi:hypothetical protein